MAVAAFTMALQQTPRDPELATLRRRALDAAATEAAANEAREEQMKALRAKAARVLRSGAFTIPLSFPCVTEARTKYELRHHWTVCVQRKTTPDCTRQ